jgi:integrase
MDLNHRPLPYQGKGQKFGSIFLCCGIVEKSSLQEGPEVDLKTYIEDLLAAENLRPSTLATYASVMRNHIVPGLGHFELEEVKPVQIRSFFADLYRRKVGVGAIDMVYRLLSKAFRAAISDQMIDRSPMAAVRRPRQSRIQLDPPTAAELDAIVAAIQPRYRALTLVMAWCGLRIGEAAGLRVADWDPESRRIYVRQQSARYGIGDLKTDASRRMVVAPRMVAAELDRHIKKYPPTDGLLFATRVGNAVTNDSYYGAFQTACRKAGLRRFHPHELRHHAVTAMARSGAPIKAVQAAVGHASSKMTLEVYSHVNQQDLVDIADRLDAVHDVPAQRPADDQAAQKTA